MAKDEHPLWAHLRKQEASIAELGMNIYKKVLEGVASKGKPNDRLRKKCKTLKTKLPNQDSYTQHLHRALGENPTGHLSPAIADIIADILKYDVGEKRKLVNEVKKFNEKRKKRKSFLRKIKEGKVEPTRRRLIVHES